MAASRTRRCMQKLVSLLLRQLKSKLFNRPSATSSDVAPGSTCGKTFFETASTRTFGMSTGSYIARHCSVLPCDAGSRCKHDLSTLVGSCGLPGIIERALAMPMESTDFDGFVISTPTTARTSSGLPAVLSYNAFRSALLIDPRRPDLGTSMFTSSTNSVFSSRPAGSSIVGSRGSSLCISLRVREVKTVCVLGGGRSTRFCHSSPKVSTLSYTINKFPTVVARSSWST